MRVPTDLWLIRHGHTSSNGGSDEPTLSGVTDVPLSELGRREVALLTARLVQNGVRFDVIVSSPLARAADTALALSRAGVGPVQFDEQLREIHCGELEGMPVRLVQQHHPELWSANLRQEDDTFCWPGGETYKAFRKRVWNSVASLAGRFGGQRLALVTHAGVISQLLGAMAGLRAAQWDPFRPGNTALTRVEWSEGSARLLCFDDRAHLWPEPPQAFVPADA
jgi:alpha-ribazole phosphatase/probable phosphoglycerate mutase